MDKIFVKSTKLLTIVSILIVFTIIISIMFWNNMKLLNNAYSDMTKIEFISSSTQRLISIAQTDNFLQVDVFFIGDTTLKTLSVESEVAISVLSNENILNLSNDVINCWYQIEQVLRQEVLNSSDLRLLRDAHFKSITNLSNGINDYTIQLNEKIVYYKFIVIALFFIIALVMLSNSLRSKTELIQNKEIIKNAQIDSSTGLYNRSRCQDLFKNNPKPATIKCPAIIVLDLNDLKKVNDSQGHRMGDALIANFASLLKSASNVHFIPPFIGRYGGDEFVIFYEDISDENVIKDFLKELAFLTKNFNNASKKFKISYAHGYAFVSSKSKEELTIKELFDKADEAMYANKLENKNIRNI